MIMAPVSSHSTTPAGDEPTDNIPFRKRASIHYPEGSSSAKRMSLSFGPRARSHSESWVLTPTTIVPAKEKEASLLPTSTTIPTLSSLSSSPSKAETMDTDGPKEHGLKDQVNPELMTTLASFLKGHQESTTTSERSKHTKDAVGGETKEDIDLVITVRDFAYPKTHPYHFGQYPPEPEYEESDIEEEEEEVEEDEEEDDYAHENDDENLTQGQARGLYDFDAENESELSFREGDMVWIHCRQFPGWFLGEMEGATGLVPENYVQFV